MLPEQMIEDIIKAMKNFIAKDIATLAIKNNEAIDTKINQSLDEAVKRKIATMPKPASGKDGRDGRDGVDGINGRDGIDGANGRDGSVASLEDIKFVVDSILRDVAPSIKEPQKVNINDFLPVIETIVNDKVSAIPKPVDGRDGEDGRDGREAFDIEIEPGIKEEDSYARGIYAMHRGGLWRSHEQTKGMRGWECIVVGISDISIDYDGERGVTIAVSKSNGEEQIKKINMPVMLDKGIYRDDYSYLKGDTVTFSGAMWIAQTDKPRGRPGASEDWRLSVKRGGTGKSAFDLARDGGFTGTRQEWLDGLGKRPIVKLPTS